jgi:molybdopterin-guanine dinucleotide biosynthesis protein A
MTTTTGVILAGGLGRRMGGNDKGLVPYRGRPLAAFALERLAPQVDEVLINANRNIERYAALGASVVEDSMADHPGPLAGMQAGLARAHHELVLFVPCDAPRFPDDLAQRLARELDDERIDASVARAGGRVQPVFCLVRRATLPRLTQFLEDGGRKVETWLATLRTATVDFPDADAFANLNTAEELQQSESQGAPASRK